MSSESVPIIVRTVPQCTEDTFGCGCDIGSSAHDATSVPILITIVITSTSRAGTVGCDVTAPGSRLGSVSVMSMHSTIRGCVGLAGRWDGCVGRGTM